MHREGEAESDGRAINMTEFEFGTSLERLDRMPWEDARQYELLESRRARPTATPIRCGMTSWGPRGRIKRRYSADVGIKGVKGRPRSDILGVDPKCFEAIVDRLN